MLYSFVRGITIEVSLGQTRVVWSWLHEDMIDHDSYARNLKWYYDQKNNSGIFLFIGPPLLT